MNRTCRRPRAGSVTLLACAAALVLGPAPASPRLLELVEQQVDARISLPRALTFSPDGRHLYVAGNHTIVFERDDATGELAFVDATSSTNALAMSPDGRNLYARQYGQVQVFARHPETGTPLFLEAWMSGMDGIAHLSVAAVTVSPDGRHVYVATHEATLEVFARDGRTGVLSHLETLYDGFDGVSGLDGARHLALSPDGAHLYVASSPSSGGQPGLAIFGRDVTSGALSFVERVVGDPGGVSFNGTRSLLVSPDGRHVYVAAVAGVLGFARDPSTGTLGFVDVHDDSANSIAISPDGNYLYAIGEWLRSVLTVLARDADSGALSVVETFPYGVGGLGVAAAVTVSPDGRHLYLASEEEPAVAALTRDAGSGRVSFVAAYWRDVAGDADGLADAEAVAASPDGRHLYAVSRLGAVAALARSPETGGLDFVAAYDESDGFEGLDRAVAVAVSPDGRNVYVASHQPDHALAVLARDETSGELDFLEAHVDGAGGVEGMQFANSLRVSPDGRHVYVSSHGDNAIVAFSREAASGELTYGATFVDGAGGIDGIAGIRSLALSPGGEHVYTVGYGDEALAVLARDAATGELDFIEAHVEGVAGVVGLGGGATEVTVSPDGSNVYAVNSGTGVVAFQRQATSGRLAFLEARFEDAASARSLEVSPDGEYVYVFGQELWVFSRQATNGALKLLEVESFPYYSEYWGPDGTQSPDGQHLYVAATLGSIDGLVALRRTDGPCRSDPHSLCLAGNRFRFELDWRDHAGRTGSAQGVPQGTDESGLFYYLNPDNWELQVKVIDACTYNDRFWVFAAGLTDVEVELTVTDSWTGAVRRYSNPLRTPFQPIQDIDAFFACELGGSPPGPDPPDGGEALLLLDGRFRVAADWTIPNGTAGDGVAVPLTDQSGYFWFFGPDNVEVVVKVLDGCGYNDRFWVFATGLTDVGVELTVTDVESGVVKSYSNPLGQPFVPILDTAALRCP